VLTEAVGQAHYFALPGPGLPESTPLRIAVMDTRGRR
jgi:hypothetical protein